MVLLTNNDCYVIFTTIIDFYIICSKYENNDFSVKLTCYLEPLLRIKNIINLYKIIKKKNIPKITTISSQYLYIKSPSLTCTRYNFTRTLPVPFYFIQLIIIEMFHAGILYEAAAMLLVVRHFQIYSL